MATDVSYSYSADPYVGYSQHNYDDGVVESGYSLSEDGSLLEAYRTVEPETGGYEYYGYENWEGSPTYSYEYVYPDDTAWGGYSESVSDAPFDTDALLARITGDFPRSSYGIFDLENSWIDYEGDGLGPISLEQVFATNATHVVFYGGAINASLIPDYQIAAVSITYTNLAAVPEPETWGMLLSGLGLMGLIARRRRKHG
jgi:hypothetical protein